jgi:hypothetical protein
MARFGDSIHWGKAEGWSTKSASEKDIGRALVVKFQGYCFAIRRRPRAADGSPHENEAGRWLSLFPFGCKQGVMPEGAGGVPDLAIGVLAGILHARCGSAGQVVDAAIAPSEKAADRPSLRPGPVLSGSSPMSRPRHSPILQRSAAAHVHCATQTFSIRLPLLPTYGC